ncbi:hypothetical protein SAY86_005775 [Trapa natans]|uniref:Uncharacterized protein n=1 Tax=Trapa natans TaxID=22666 RepID=A0AAN7L0K6_TRANT|nr:hypothetical protein SAY86_005775 [Trapa natans]
MVHFTEVAIKEIATWRLSKKLGESLMSEIVILQKMNHLNIIRDYRGVQPSDYTVPVEVKAAGFQICAEEIGSIVEGRDIKKFKFHGGIDGIAKKLSTSTTSVLTTASELMDRKQEIFGINKFAESESRSFWICVGSITRYDAYDTCSMCICFLDSWNCHGRMATRCHDGLLVTKSLQMDSLSMVSLYQLMNRV